MSHYLNKFYLILQKLKNMKSNKIFFLICCLIIQSFQSIAQQNFTTKKSVQNNTKALVLSQIGPHLESTLKKSIEGNYE